MDMRRIGQLEVSVVGLGCNNFGMRIGEEDTRLVVDAALDAGINYFDTADVYGQTRSEEFLGTALRGRREQAVVATKFGSMGSADGTLSGGHPDWVRRAVDDSLGRLGIEVIDHYQYHRLDPDVPMEETMGALEELVAAGKVREIGCSNFDVELLDRAADVSRERSWQPFASVQNRYSALHREPETSGVIEACARHGVALVPYFPLESGLLTGKVGSDGSVPEGSRLDSMPDDRRARFLDDQRLTAVGELTRFAADRDRSLLELAFGYLLGEPTVASVIAGATSADQVRSNVAAAGWTMDADDRAEVARLAG
ncbi:aldo/keto reductase [Actinomarinicola tropica]|uniref:Aldo/keto reductase n=1 Tax=Actinomarinicola tropica TaxID=2789776 RepID=A0A5Q2RHQ0_9ACTN|nr:aldo/keto reductase [Actinomarinicola tropica]QGG95114.1 aldo/keto reductase [Actinomarinicola tropica]